MITFPITWLPNRIWWQYRSTVAEWCKQSVLPIDQYSLASEGVQSTLQMYWKPHTLGSKITEAFNPKLVFKVCEGIPCSSFSVKELDVIVHKKYFPCITILNFGDYVRQLTSEPGGWGGRYYMHSHQTLFKILLFQNCNTSSAVQRYQWRREAILQYIMLSRVCKDDLIPH